jgi:hypothetical protein
MFICVVNYDVATFYCSVRIMAKTNGFVICRIILGER